MGILDSSKPVAIASDHAGVDMKSALVQAFGDRRASIVDLGPSSSAAVDYPDFAERLARQVAAGQAAAGILICGTGIGMSMAANKVDGVRAALVTDPVMAGLARRHNDANVLCLGARIIGLDLAKACVDAFLGGEFDPGDDGRHRRRVDAIAALE